MSIEAELAQLRTPLLRFAQLQLRDQGLAEDAVSETLLAILEKPAAYEGRSSLRTYATGILKFKIIDVMRLRGREVAIEPVDEQSLQDAIDALFAADGHYRDHPPAWQQPDRALEQAQFFEHLQRCLERLPPKIGRVFLLRERLGWEVTDICRELDITANHCGVLLYRARMQLRVCLQHNWFGQTY